MYITQPWFQDDLGVVRPNSRQAGLTERACRSPTRLTNANANSRAVFSESTLRLEDCNGSNGGPFTALSTVMKIQFNIELLFQLRELVIKYLIWLD